MKCEIIIGLFSESISRIHRITIIRQSLNKTLQKCDVLQGCQHASSVCWFWYASRVRVRRSANFARTREGIRFVTVPSKRVAQVCCIGIPMEHPQGCRHATCLQECSTAPIPAKVRILTANETYHPNLGACFLVIVLHRIDNHTIWFILCDLFSKMREILPWSFGRTSGLWPSLQEDFPRFPKIINSQMVQ